MLLNNWLNPYLRESQAPRKRALQSKRGHIARLSAVQHLEDRTLLSAVTFTPGLTLPDVASDVARLTAQPGAGNPANGAVLKTRDAGDSYLYQGQEIPLLRAEEEFVVTFSKSVESPGRSLEALLDAPGIAGNTENVRLRADISSYEFISSRTAVVRLKSFSDGAGFDADTVVRSLRNRADIEWVGQRFVSPESDGTVVVTNELVIAFEPGADPYPLLSTLSGTYRLLRGTSDTFVVTLDDAVGSSVLQLARSISQQKGVRYSSPNFYSQIQFAATPNDPLYSSQWHLNNTGQSGGQSGADARLADAWDTEKGSNDIVIAVLDSGVDRSHPDLNIFVNTDEVAGDGIDNDGNGYIDDVNGWDFQSNDNDPSPDLTGTSTETVAHGTAVAGVAGAIGDNANGVTGVSQSVGILPVKSTDENGSLVADSAKAEAVRYAAGQITGQTQTWRGADIINASWGTTGTFSSVVKDAFDWAESDGRDGLGTTTLAAAGNSANGYITRSYQLSAADTSVAFVYEKNASGSAGDDSVWLGQVTFPDGAVERFSGTALPAGWITWGDADWEIVSDPERSNGGPHVGKAGAIGDNQFSALSALACPPKTDPGVMRVSSR